MTAAGDRAAVTVLVRVPPDRAWELFTAHLDRWWRTGPQYRIAGKQPGALQLSPGVGGELTETFLLRGRERRFVVGTITTWEPPTHLRSSGAASTFSPTSRRWSTCGSRHRRAARK